MREHVYHGDCGGKGCPICEGLLQWCRVCGGSEGSLPDECPGEEMTEAEELDVYAGRKNFVGGKWVRQSQKGRWAR